MTAQTDPPTNVGSTAGLGPTLAERLIGVASRIRTRDTLFRDDEIVGEASYALKETIEQVGSLRAALLKVLDTRNREAKATMSYQNARENFSDSTDERKAQERAMLAASDAEREARVLLLTLRDGA